MRQKEKAMNAISTKRVLTPDVLAAQGAFELPDRQMLALVTVVITNLLNNLSVDVDIRNNNVALQVCAVVAALNSEIGTQLTCVIGQGQ
jgi:hypothetical protein